MKMLSTLLFLLPVLGLWSSPASAQYDRNLAACLSGAAPYMCHHELLTPEQAQAVRQAELAKNYATCSTGSAPYLCKHEWLTPEQAETVRQAELAKNYATCSTGSAPYLCKHEWLTPEQAETARQAELGQNYAVCSTGSSPFLCKHELLTPAQRATVDEAERRVNFTTCIRGISPFLCKHNLLTPQQAAEVRQAEHSVNRQTCANPALQFNCHRDWLAEDNASAQGQAYAPAQTAGQTPLEQNYATCIKGTLSSLCDHSLLTPPEATEVRQVEHQINRRACETPSLQWSCHRDWLAEDDRDAARQAVQKSAQNAAPTAPAGTGASSPSPVANLGPSVVTPDTPVNTPVKPRCEAFWLGAVETNGDYAFLSDYTRLRPAADSDKTILREWHRGQRLVRCGPRLTNKETNQSIDVSG
ncbi:hypothetical protein [Paraburkholderia sp. CI3]|uniref:hypothetical protein n=1 Tax=Paraburkholderia sp. CI3 TaxID=2991060 RepID=UPI003D23318E